MTLLALTIDPITQGLTSLDETIQKFDLRTGPPCMPANVGSPTPDVQSEACALTCSGVWKVYGGRTPFDPSSPDDAAGGFAAVRDVSLGIKPGEIFVLMGLSGCGKSTLLRLLSSLVPVSAGTVSIEGRDISQMSEPQLRDLRRSAMSMVFQDFALLPHLTVLDNVAFPLAAAGINREERREAARALLDRVKLVGKEQHYPHELSGGQKQRVGIARSLANNPRIWFLDEPFSALDPVIRYDLQTELMRLHRELGKTIVFVTHDFEEAIRLGSRIAVMRDGAIVQIDTPERLILAPADAEVSRFTSRIERAKVVTVMALADPKLIGVGTPIAGSTRLNGVLDRFIGHSHPVPVTDDTGRICGAVSPLVVAGLLAKGTS